MHSGVIHGGTDALAPGATVHVLRVGTVAEFAAADWGHCFRRVRLDLVRGLVTVMSISPIRKT